MVCKSYILQTMVGESSNGYFDQLFDEHISSISKNCNSENGGASDKNNNNNNNIHNNGSQTLTSLGGTSGGDDNDSVENNIGTRTELKEDRGGIIGDNSSDKKCIDYIILVTVCKEYASLITICLCILLRLFSLIIDLWFWDEFVLFCEHMTDKHCHIQLMDQLYGGLIIILYIFECGFCFFGLFVALWQLESITTRAALRSTKHIFGRKVFGYIVLGLYNVKNCVDSHEMSFECKRCDMEKKMSIKDIVRKKKLIFVLKSLFFCVNIAWGCYMCLNIVCIRYNMPINGVNTSVSPTRAKIQIMVKFTHSSFKLVEN